MKVVFGAFRRHPFRLLSAGIVLAVALGAFMARDILRVAVAPEPTHDLTLPQLPSLSAADGETLYWVDASQSKATVEVREILAGVAKKVELSTQVMGGQVGIGRSAPTVDGQPEATPVVRLGEFVVNVGELRSDNSLRDKMLRHQFLESHDYPVVRLLDASVTLPSDASAESTKGATLTGDLEVKGKRFSTIWTIDARMDGANLVVNATTSVKMSELGVGPINKVGLVSTSDDMEIRLRLLARDASSYSPPKQLSIPFSSESPAVFADKNPSGDKDRSGRPRPVESAGAPSFSSDIAPILSENCASCHQRGAAGASMWTLEVARDASAIADGLAVVTGSKYMPPWPPSGVGVPLQHARGLTKDQIASIAKWAAAGGILDVAPTAPVSPPANPEMREPRPDRVVELAEPYQGSREKRDDYRCFILDPKITDFSYMTGYQFKPDKTEIVHHAIIYQADATDRERLEALDAADAGSGWSCFTGMGQMGYQIGGWVPGQRPYFTPEGTGFTMYPGDLLVAQIHYHFDLATPPDRSSVTIELADSEAATSMEGLYLDQLVAPVEFPCPSLSDGPLCDREASLAETVTRFGPGALLTANGLHRNCGTTPESVAAASDGTTAVTTCDFAVGAGQVVSFLAHMHQIGSSYRMTLNPDTPGEKVLLDIPSWNFAWQLDYQPTEQIILKSNDVVRVRCEWDRRRRFNPVPRYIVFADGTEDEMCFSTLIVRPMM